MTELLNGRYEVGGLLGAGGMGRVHRGRDVLLGRDVAIKILRGDQVADAAARERFLAEARTAGGLHHPGIATVHDVGEDADSADGDPYIVMQLVEGTTVSEAVRQRGTLESDAVERLVAGVADALAAAHAAGVVHRDVKPANIVLSAGSVPVLVDFGIALGPAREPLTATGAVLGTVEYLSPEQARGQTASGASDVYSLGLVAYHCLVGTSPFRRETAVATALAQVGEALPPLPEAVPADLAALIRSMTAKDPAARPSAAQVRDAVGSRTGGATAVLPAVGLAHEEPTGPVTEVLAAPTATLPAPASTSRRGGAAVAALAAPRNRVRVVGGAVAVALVALVLGLTGAMSDGDGPTAPDVVGDTVESATDEIEALEADVRTEPVDDPDARAGVVVAQSPAAGAPLPEDGPVVLQVATGQVDVPADDLVGEPVAEARSALEDLGLQVTTTEVASQETAGDVVALDRSGRLDVGSTVTLSVAVAPEPVAPVVTGPTEPENPGKEGKGQDKEPKDDSGKGSGKKDKP